jgi:hypothetical protein
VLYHAGYAATLARASARSAWACKYIARTSLSCLSYRPATDRYLRINSCSRDRYGSSVSSDTSRPSNAPASGISQLHRALRTNFADTGSTDYPPAAKLARLTPLIVTLLIDNAKCLYRIAARS